MALDSNRNLRRGSTGADSVNEALNARHLGGTYTVASIPAAADNEGVTAYVSNGAAGNPILAFSNGTDWLRSDTGAAIAAS